MPFIDELVAAKAFTRKDNHFELSKDYMSKNSWRFKKITGTKFSAILGLGKFNSPFKLWCGMVGIYKEEMDPTLSKIGQLAEPKIRDYAAKHLGYDFIVYEPSQVKWDVFKDVDKVFGGIPDGEPKGLDGKPDYSNGKRMLEVKSSSIDKFVYKSFKGELRMQKDANGIPLVKQAGAKKLEWFDSQGKIVPSKDYQGQLGLYLYLRGQTQGIFAVGFLTPDEYAHPEKFVPSKDNVYLIDFSLKNVDEFAKAVEQARAWYNKYVKTGISPEITAKDEQWLQEVELKLN